MNSDLDEFHRPLRAVFFGIAGDARRAPLVQLLSPLHMPVETLGPSNLVRPFLTGEPVNAHSLVDGHFLSRAAGREFPVLHMHIDAPRGERSGFVSIVLHFAFHLHR